MGSWPSNVTLIRNNQSVDEQTINRPLHALWTRTDYLKERLDAQAVGEGIVLYSQPIEDAVTLYDVVYYDTATGLYKQALAVTEISDDGILKLADSAYVAGIVIRKISSTTADILIQGKYNSVYPTGLDAVALTAGHYYLSATTAGKLTSARPAVSLYVGLLTADGSFIVNPTPREVIEDHIHYKFELVTTPAAGNPYYDGTTTILEDEDSATEGWLNASNAIFSGTAPDGAYFGYNWMANANLAAVWPPQPTSGAVITFGGIEVNPDYVVIDDNGIWWMTNASACAPWKEITYHQSSSAAEHVVEEDLTTCTVNSKMFLWFTKLIAKTDQTVVTGVKPDTGSPIVVTSCATADSGGYYPGKVKLGVEFDWDNKTDTTSGYLVVKDISGNGALARGPVVSSISSDSELISVSGSETVNNKEVGDVVISFTDPTSISRQLQIELVALSGATENIFNGIVPYVGLPANRETYFIGKLRIPTLATGATADLTLKFTFGALGTGVMPSDLNLEWATFVPGEDMPTDWTLLNTIDLSGEGSVSQGDTVSYEATTISAIESNSVVLLKLTRPSSGGSELAIVNMYGEMELHGS